ncbi:lymphocyte antigen 6 complex locus protein G5c [Erinaceus europaeus]|uniref:Lymphocyte antigen 6 complex locus protein G5c n=1 Tax=Erinaceus europaeus TaxID=9365 RepID=A0A1S3AMB9_ERIEU|nr:lymphocyte antigen 6 complex locus protein G5c [Erinaceus europaeus]
MAGPGSNWNLGLLGLQSIPRVLHMILLIVLTRMSLVFGQLMPIYQDIAQPAQLPKYLRCYRCLLETKEIGCLLGSDICLAPPGSSCMTLYIKNSTGSEILVSDCRRKEQMSDCSYTRASPVVGFWMFSRCCFMNFCNNPQNRVNYFT